MSWDAQYYFTRTELDEDALGSLYETLKKRYGAPEDEEDDDEPLEDEGEGEDEDGEASFELAFERFSFTVYEHPAGCWVNVSGDEVDPDAVDDVDDAIAELAPVLGEPIEESVWQERAEALEARRPKRTPEGPRSTVVLVGTDIDGRECARATLPTLRYYDASNQPAHPLLSDQGRMKANVHRMSITIYDADGAVQSRSEAEFDGYGRPTPRARRS